MVSLAQLVEHQIVVLRVAGSSPVAHPIQETSGRSAAGSALALGARGRQFESDRPDHFFTNIQKYLNFRARSSVG